MNVRNAIILIIVALILAIAVQYCVQNASAVENTSAFNSSFVTIEEEKIAALNINYADSDKNFTEIINATITLAEITNKTPIRIQQGDCVFLGETIDIAGMGWYSGKLDYFGPYEDSFSVLGNETPLFQVPVSHSVKKSSRYFIDPTVFMDKPGWWYIHYPSDERAGNSRAFNVQPYCQNLIDGLMVEQTVSMADNTTINTTKQIPPLLEELWDNSDVILGRGDYISTGTPSKQASRYWIFGDDYAAYNISTHDNIVVFDSTGDMNGFSAGMYNVSIVDPGHNSIYEVEYEPQYKMYPFSNITHPVLISPFRNVDTIDINGFPPNLVEDRFLKMEQASIDDNVTRWKLNFMEPEIRVMRIDQMIVDQNYSYVDVRGYTNAVNGTEITMRIDQSKLGNLTDDPDYNAKWTTTTTGLYINAWKQFGYRIQLDTGEISPGQHYFTLTNPQGALAIVPFYVYRELPKHYQPPEYIQFVGNSPFIPTPTPEKIIEQVTVQVPYEVVRTVVEPFNYQKLIDTFLSKYAMYIILIPAGILLVWWIATLIARAIRRKNDDHDFDFYEEK